MVKLRLIFELMSSCMNVCSTVECVPDIYEVIRNKMSRIYGSFSQAFIEVKVQLCNSLEFSVGNFRKIINDLRFESQINSTKLMIVSWFPIIFLIYFPEF